MNFKTQPTLYSSGDIKIEAKAQLQGNWKEAVLLAIMPTVLSLFLVGNTADGNTESSLLVQLIFSFFGTGAAYTFLVLLRNEDFQITPFRDIFRAFRREYFLKLLFLKLAVRIYVFLWGLLFIVPGIIKRYGYSQAEYIFKDIVDRTGEQPSIRECLSESERIMQGQKMNLFSLELSFIGWYIASIFTYGLLYFWLQPYLFMSRVVFYEHVSQSEFSGLYTTFKPNPNPGEMGDRYEEVGKDPDDFRDFDDF